MSEGLEIERKFLAEMPETEKLCILSKTGITQTYLIRGENNSQRRVRKIDENGDVTYTYTEKHFITPVIRDENEREISSTEYDMLLMQRDTECVPVEKVRYRFEYKNQLFELDVYPFSDKLAILELELDTPEQKIDFPDYIKIIKDVSADKKYSNAALANAGAFPELM
ncbi:MAG: hypothetical protein PUB97_03300 [Ruminococcus sp.]|nr:hypothetical protein [Ruminococcus sp.]